MTSLHTLWELFQLPYPFLLLSMVVGAIIGSFLTVVVHRLPQMMERSWQQACQPLSPSCSEPLATEESLSFPGSYCPHCRHSLRWRDNLPLLGYLLNRGRCRQCQAPIHWRYPLLELLGVSVAALSALQFGPGLQAITATILGWALLALLFIDLEHQLLPDSITLPLLWAGLLLNHHFTLFTAPSSALWGGVAGYLALWSVYQAHHFWTGREGIGRGDFKLLAALGAWCGWELLPQILLMASLGAIVIALPLLLRKSATPVMTTAIPFGPFLAVSGWFTLLWGSLLTPVMLHSLIL